MSSELFNASIFVSEQLNRQLLNAAQDLAHRCVYECASKYNFDGEEAVRFLGLAMVKMERKAPVKEKVSKKARTEIPKAAFPLPYNGEMREECCNALRQNNGLYTQCTGLRKGEAEFCKSCATTMQKTGSEVPEYGTIQQRKAVGIFEFVDPKGRKPVSYTKVMKKYKLTKEQVVEEANKLNITILEEHFVEAESDAKRGRPSSKAEKEPKVKGVKGRPKKEKKVLEIEGDDEDLFATLVAQANVDEDAEEIKISKNKKVSVKSDEEKEAERAQKEMEKELKRKAAEEAKAEKEAKLAAEKAEREAKKEEERLAREAKKKAEEDEKVAKKLALEKAKAEKEAKLAAEKAAKEAAKAQKASGSSKKAAKKEEPEEDEEPDVVKKIEFGGKKYLKSKKTGIVYDYTEYVNNGEQVVVGKWNENTNKIDFSNDGEESEEEYDN